MVKFRLDNIVREVMDEMEMESDQSFRRLLQLGISGVRELHMDVSGAPTFDTIKIDQNSLTATLPSNLIKIIRVGSLSLQNTIIPLLTQDGMVMNDKASPSFNGCILGTFGSPAIMGSGGRVDHQNGTLKVSSDINSDCLYIEYLADITQIDGMFMVSPYEVEAVKSWIRWANIRSVEAKANLSIVYERQWNRDSGKAGSRINGVTLDQFIESYYKGLTGTIRI